MEENTRTKLLCGLLDASKLVPKLESMLRRLRAISILLMMRRDNTRSKIIHTIHSFQEQLVAFEKRALEQMEEVFNSKSEYLDMYRDSVTCDIDSLRSLSTEVESFLRYTPGPSVNNNEVHAKRLIEVFSLVLNNNIVDLDVDDDIDCLDFVQNMEEEELLNLGKVISSYQEKCPLVADFSNQNVDETTVKETDSINRFNTANKSENLSKNSKAACITGRIATKAEHYLPERKLKLAGKKLKNLGNTCTEKSPERSSNSVISDEQEKIMDVNQTMTYSSVVKCENVQAILHSKSPSKNTKIEENVKKPDVLSSPPPKEIEQEVQYVSSEDRQRWKKSLDDMLTNVPKPTFKVAAELLMNITKDGSKESSDQLTQEEEEGEEEEEEGKNGEEEVVEEEARTPEIDSFSEQKTANESLSMEAQGKLDYSDVQVINPEKDILLAQDDQVVMEDLLWEEGITEPVSDQVVPDFQHKDCAHDGSPRPNDTASSSNMDALPTTVSTTTLTMCTQPETVQESEIVPRTVSPSHIPTIRMFIQKNEINRDGATVPAKLEVKLGHPGRGSGGCLHFPIGVTTDFEGNILVTDTGNHLVKVFDKEGIFKYTIGDTIVPPFTRPSAIVVNAEGKIFVKDDVCIHKFTSTGRYLCRLGAKKFNMPYGLALTSKGDLITLDICPGNSRIFIISPDGFYGMCYPFQPLINCGYESKCRFLTVHNDTLYVSDLGCNCVYITDLYGTLLRTIGHSGHRLGLFSQAAGIAVDRDGYIIVADSRNERVQIFQPNGRFLGVLALSDPHIRPSDIHLTPDGRLIIVNFTNHEVKVFRLCVK
ncbi:E3 ubiquitin-protein ligase TRIM71-like isoform X2 [Mizuhopecten yessoensis]|uniref:E3 ubiquitin-protein ligase TRIM71 n=1 Tax=Mizuhopecten yessoensis TaxID=6573 RepID=A0A210PP83_MIZYE|nr:E3 ubiquitin-protein ligase TRIM71-like isoform X2 [Mizuhopecten yessoensis]OWF38264.1 E3 ubiquitin-protein ligase TRIM71 [Mizuhopecten yessoensis]